MKYFAGAIAASIIAVTGASQAATLDVVQYPTGYFAPDEAATYDLPFYRGYGEDWGWSHGVIANAFTSATLSISAFDVDYSSGEVDEIYVMNDGSWELLGTLVGQNDAYAYTTFTLGSDLFDEVASGLEVFMKIDVQAQGWYVTLGKSVLSLDGSVLPPPEPSPVPVPAAGLLLFGGMGALAGLRRLRNRG